MQIRHASPDDATAIAALISELTREHIAGDCTPAALEILLASMTADAVRERMQTGHAQGCVQRR